MSSAPDLLAAYGLGLIFAWAFVVQAGAPVPAVPMLLGAGALAGTGRIDLALAIAAAMGATVAADVLWYSLGRSYGTRVLELLCRFALDPDSLIRHAKERFVAHRLRYLVLAKFLPGVNPLAAGLAGTVPIRLERFVIYAAAGALLWAGAWMILGYLCADVIARIATGAGRLGTPLVILIVAALVLYLAYKFARRQRFLRHLRHARITSIELKRRLDAGDQPVIFDLRTTLDIETTPYGIPGARWIAPETLDEPHQLINKHSEVVFYCAEPKEATSARRALLLARHGYTNVHPLCGGLEAWREAGFDVEPVHVDAPPPEVRAR
jgi:membrane protein DedA with SNARE-associated domain/rhodanese-related sulfurtransferase